MSIEFREGGNALPPNEFVSLAERVWRRSYDSRRVAEALSRTINIGAWDGTKLVGAVRVLSDGYLFSTVPELMVDPDYRGRGLGRALVKRALECAPGGALFLGAQPGNESFFERIGFRRGPIGYVGIKASLYDTVEHGD